MRRGSSYRPPSPAGSPSLRGRTVGPATPPSRSAGKRSHRSPAHGERSVSSRDRSKSRCYRPVDRSSPSGKSGRRSSHSTDRRKRSRKHHSLSASGWSGDRPSTKKPRRESKSLKSSRRTPSWTDSSSDSRSRSPVRRSRSLEGRQRSHRSVQAATAAVAALGLDPMTLQALEVYFASKAKPAEDSSLGRKPSLTLPTAPAKTESVRKRAPPRWGGSGPSSPVAGPSGLPNLNLSSDEGEFLGETEPESSGFDSDSYDLTTVVNRTSALGSPLWPTGGSGLTTVCRVVSSCPFSLCPLIVLITFPMTRPYGSLGTVMMWNATSHYHGTKRSRR